MVTALSRRPSRYTKPIRRPSQRLRVEQLEVRAVPATIAWDGGPTGMGTNWLDPANWVGDVLPGANDDAVISTTSTGQPASVNLNASAAVHQLTIDSGAALQFGGSNATLALSLGLLNRGAFDFVAGGGMRTISGRMDNQGTLAVNSGVTWHISGASTSSGTIAVTGGDLTLDQTAPQAAFGTTGTVTVAAGRTFTISGGEFANFSNTTLSGSTFNLAGSFRFPGADVRTLAANLTLDGPGSSILNSVTSVDGLAALGNIAAAGRLTLRNGRIMTNTVMSAGIITGSGSIASILNMGAVKPGNNIGIMACTGAFYDYGYYIISPPFRVIYVGGTLETELNGRAPGTEYDQVTANYVSLDTRDGDNLTSGRLAVSVGYAAVPGDTFKIIDNRGTSPVYGTFNGLPEGATLTASNQTFRISYIGGDGNDVTLTRLQNLSFVAKVDLGNPQRSSITKVRVVFDRIISYLGSPDTAFKLQKIVGGKTVGNVGLSVSTVTISDHSEATLTFLSDTAFGSLVDGRYRLNVIGEKIVSNGTQMESNFVLDFHRLYGDANGDGHVDIADLGLFSSTYGKQVGDPGYLGYFDYNGDGRIDAADLGQFAVRMFTKLP